MFEEYREKYISRYDLLDLWTVAVAAVYTWDNTSQPEVIEYLDWEHLSLYIYELGIRDHVLKVCDHYILNYRDSVKSGKIPSLISLVLNEMRLQLPQKYMDPIEWQTTDELVKKGEHDEQ